MVTPVRMHESGEVYRKTENSTCKEDVLQDKLIETTNPPTEEKDKEKNSEIVSCKITGLESEPHSEKNSLTPIPSMT